MDGETFKIPICMPVIEQLPDGPKYSLPGPGCGTIFVPQHLRTRVVVVWLGGFEFVPPEGGADESFVAARRPD